MPKKKPAEKKPAKAAKTTKVKAAKDDSKALAAAEPKAAAPVKAPKSSKASKAARTGPSLLVVESPAKERTISRFLKNEFVVKSSFGHVRDLPVRKIGVNVDDDFAPQYVVLPRAKKILAEFKSLVSKAPFVYLATDHDREGESIAWHLVDMLKLKPDQVKRITFHEITPTAIKAAIAEPRAIDENLVHAQQARRVIDRLVGYKLSPLLWAKIQSGLSAGRVQSVAVRLLAEREHEITGFASEGYWTLTAALEKNGAPPVFDAKLSLWKKEKVETTRTYDLFSEQYRVKATTLRTAEDMDVVSKTVQGGAFKVVKVEKKEVRRRPPPPFSTSTLQQAASQKMGFAAERTMRIAQSLYEGVDLGGTDPAGLITYMRTDSFSIAKTAAEECAAFVKESYGAHYAPAEPPTYQTKSRGAQEAHEAIRPTHPESGAGGAGGGDQGKLYRLIWQRFIACQMAPGKDQITTIDVACAPDAWKTGKGDMVPMGIFQAKGKVLLFDGWRRLAGEDATEEAKKKGKKDAEEPEDDESDGELPMLNPGDPLNLLDIAALKRSTKPPPPLHPGVFDQKA